MEVSCGDCSFSVIQDSLKLESMIEMGQSAVASLTSKQMRKSKILFCSLFAHLHCKALRVPEIEARNLGF